MASYVYPSMFESYFLNYLKESETTNPDMLDINKHLITIDLAVYDEVQW